ncbi:MAG: hypothetical protein K6A69_10195 [Lachnospiraceae bacterium]|nr:hypothetical protein [Lachnospiraceae bacterium]
MKKKLSVIGIMAITVLALFAGCGKKADSEFATAEDIQPTLTYFGSLKANDTDDQMAVFKNENGDVIYLFKFDGVLDYGIVEETGTATTDDGQEYATVDLMETYGYYFTNEDATEGILVKDGEVLKATELGEEGARELVNETL